MNQIIIGKFIAQKRKEQNFTQEQLAEQLGVSNKTISKWECGKCMPDYAVIKPLCQVLDISIAELMNGEAQTGGDFQFDDEQLLQMLERIQSLEKQNLCLFGILLIGMGIAMLAVSQLLDGSAFKDFLSGLFVGISVGEMLTGVFILSHFIRK